MLVINHLARIPKSSRETRRPYAGDTKPPEENEEKVEGERAKLERDSEGDRPAAACSLVAISYVRIVEACPV